MAANGSLARLARSPDRFASQPMDAGLHIRQLVVGCFSSCRVRRWRPRSGRQAANKQPALPWYSRAPDVTLGWIKSLTPLGAGYKLRLDLYLLFGRDKTGIAACVDNHEMSAQPGGILDDKYEHDLHYLVTYYVPPTTPANATARSPVIVVSSPWRRVD